MSGNTVCEIPRGTRVVVTGATGFTGSVLTRALVGAGLDVSAVAREGADRSRFGDLPIRWVTGDVADERTIAAAVDGCQYIFHLAAAYREAKLSEATYRRVHVTSTQRLAESASKTPGFRRFVHVSTVGVHGHIDHPPADENTPFHPGDSYQVTKMEAEQWLRDFAPRNDLPYTIVRPCAIYGPGDRRLLKLFRLATYRYFLMLGQGRCLYHLIHVDDLSDILMLAATRPGALGEAIIAGNPEPISLEEVARVIASTFNRQTRPVRVPAWPAFAAAAVCETICKPLGIEPPLYRRRVAFYTKDRAFDTRKLRAVIAPRYRYTNEEGLRETARWYARQGWLRV
jgi:dihydroflavonol-4-reductase